MAKGEKKKGGQKVEKILLRLKVFPEDKSSKRQYQCNVDEKDIQKIPTRSEKERIKRFPEEKEDVVDASPFLGGGHIEAFLHCNLEAPIESVMVGVI